MASKRGSKKAYTGKQKRQAEHIADSYAEKGVSKKTAKARAYATVNKQDGGGKKSGSGRAGAKKKTAKKKTATKKSAAPKKRSTKKSAAKKKSGAKKRSAKK